MLVRGHGVNRRSSGDNQRNNPILRLVHYVHDAAETFRIRCDAGERVGHPARSLGMKKYGIRFVSGPGFADRLARTGDSGRLRGPIFATLALGLQGVVTPGNAARFSDKTIFVGAERTEVALLPINIHRSGGSAVIRFIALDDDANPTFLSTLGLSTGVALRTIGRLGARQAAHG